MSCNILSCGLWKLVHCNLWCGLIGQKIFLKQVSSHCMHKISLLNYLRLVCKSEYTRMLGDECPRSLVKRCSFTVQIY